MLLPQVKLDAFFPKVGELFEHKDFILNVRRTGVEVNVFLPFGLIILDMTEHERSIQENLWVLKDFLKEGVRIYWDPNWDSNRTAVLVIDDNTAVQLEGSDHYILREFGPKFLHSNSFNILRGKVQVVQKLHRKPPDFDFVFRVDDYPIFLSSDRLTCICNVGDEVEVAYLVNLSGFGTRTPYAPAEIFYEGLGMRLVKKANTAVPYEPKDLHTMVESLMQGLLPRYSDIITKERMEKWASNVRRTIREKLNKEMLFLDVGDDSFIYRTVESVTERMQERLEHNYLSRGLMGQLSLRFLRYKTKLRDRLLGVP
jgi:hypothetical protein